MCGGKDGLRVRGAWRPQLVKKNATSVRNLYPEMISELARVSNLIKQIARKKCVGVILLWGIKAFVR